MLVVPSSPGADPAEGQARLLGVSSQDIAALLNMSLNGYVVTSFREGEKTIDVLLRGDREERNHLSALSDLAVPTRAGKSVPLSQIGRLKHSFEPGLIWRRDRQPTITVRGNLYGKTQPATIVGRLKPNIDAIQATLPSGYRIADGGSVEESAKGSSSVMAGLPLFLLAVVTILMIQLQSVSRVIMVLCTVVHFYTTGHITMVTALKAIDAEFEAVSASLKVPQYKTFWRVTLPICLPVLLDVSRYFFINAMTTISAVVFLYSPDTRLASLAILNLDEAGDTGPAAAMAVLIAATSAVVTLAYLGLGKLVDKRTQAWRAPAR